MGPHEKATTRAGQIQVGTRFHRVASGELSRRLAQALRDALEEHAPDLGRLPRARIERSVLEKASESLRACSRRVRGVSKSRFLSELERQNHRVLRDCDDARTELLQLRSRLEHLRTPLAEPERVDPEIELKLDTDMENELRGVFARFGRGARRQHKGLEEATVGMVLSFARRQRWELLQQRLPAHRAKIEVLERRIDKLNAALARTESAMHEIAREHEVDTGVASVYREVQGLGRDASGAAAKHVMLTEIFQANVRLQGGNAA